MQFCFDDYGFLVYLKSGCIMTPILLYIVMTALAFRVYYFCLWFYTHFRIFSCSVKNTMDIFVRISLNLQITLDSMDTLKVMIFPI
jgi:hypothetical protein